MNEEKAAIERRRRERDEQHLYIPTGVVTEANFRAYQGFDITSWEVDPASANAPKIHRILKTMTVSEFSSSLAKEHDHPPEHVRLWVMVNRQNKTIRPDQPLPDPNISMEAAYNKYGGRDKQFRLWLETANDIEDGKPKWPETQQSINDNSPILLFLKYFDTDNQTLLGVGHIYVKKQSKVSEIVPQILRIMTKSFPSSSLFAQSATRPSVNGFPASIASQAGQSTAPSLTLFEEIKQSMIEPMKPKITLQQSELQDGDIICFQKTLSEKE